MTESIEEALDAMVPEEEKIGLDAVPTPNFVLGVLEGPPPELPPPPFDIEKRDALYFQLEGLRSIQNPTPEQIRRINSLERELSALLEDWEESA